jgi:hypothetical protein
MITVRTPHSRVPLIAAQLASEQPNRNRHASTISQDLSCLTNQVQRASLITLLIVIAILSAACLANIPSRWLALLMIPIGVWAILTIPPMWQRLDATLAQVSQQQQRFEDERHELVALRQLLAWQQQWLDATHPSHPHSDSATRLLIKQICQASYHTDSPAIVRQYHSDLLQLIEQQQQQQRTIQSQQVAHERLQQGLAVIWDLTGLLYVPTPASLGTIQMLASRFVSALELNWMSLLAPSAEQPLQVVLSATQPGTLAGPNPQAMRVAIATLHHGQCFVRSEGNASLACFPIQRFGHAPLVLAVHGLSDDAVTQSLLLVAGECFARLLDRSAASEPSTPNHVEHAYRPAPGYSLN